MLDEHVLLVSNSDTSLRSLSVSLGGLKDTLELIDGDFLLGSIFLREIVLVGVKCEAGGGGPCVTVMTVDGSELIDTSQCVLLLVVIKLVDDLMQICVPT